MMSLDGCSKRGPCVSAFCFLSQSIKIIAVGHSHITGVQSPVLLEQTQQQPKFLGLVSELHEPG